MAGGGSSNVDDIIKEWRQGDVTLDADLEFVHSADLTNPLTEPAQMAAEAVLAEGDSLVNGPSAVGGPVVGLVVTSQTCDVVRPAATRPFVEVAPLVEVPDEAALEHVRRMKVPSRAYVPGVADRRLVADLDRTMTIEKPVLARWNRVEGCRNDAEMRAFQNALTRKRGRFAFPDEFEEAAKKFHKRFNDRAGKDSPEGHYVDALAEIRVRASPSWDAAEVELEFLFIKDLDPPGEKEDELPGSQWPAWQKDWESLFKVGGRFKRVFSTVTRHEDMTARDYLDTDPLDFDRLSMDEE